VKLPAQYAKFLAAIAGQVIVYLQWKYGNSGAQWLPIVLAAQGRHMPPEIPLEE
jgi:hypothetical protein